MSARDFSLLSNLLRKRAQMTYDLNEVQMEIDAFLGASAIVVAEASARGNGHQVAARPELPERITKYLPDRRTY